MKNKIFIIMFLLVVLGIVGGVLFPVRIPDSQPAPGVTATQNSEQGLVGTADAFIYKNTVRIYGYGQDTTMRDLSGKQIYPIPGSPPTITIKEVIKEIPTYITIEKEKLVEKVIEKIVYTGNLTTFKSVMDIRVWVYNWQYKPNPDWVQTAPGALTFDPQANDCDKYMLQMIQAGIRDGYYFGLVVNTTPGGDLQGQALVMTLVGNQIYFIDAQNKSIFKTLNGSEWTLDK